MAVERELLEMLRCPETRQRVAPADGALIESLNQAIRAGRVKNNAGQTLATPIQGGLVREDGAMLFPIIDSIPNLLVDRAIKLSQLTSQEA